MQTARTAMIGPASSAPRPASKVAVPFRTDPIDRLRQLVDGRLEELLCSDERGRTPLVQAMRHVTLAPGKRLRPLLAMCCAADLGADELVALDVGCALELVHAASLVLDDLPCMDDALLRRGRPAAHVAFGEDVAILASIGLLSSAFELVASLRHLDPAVRSDLCRLLASHVGPAGLVGGQFDDLRGALPRTDAVEQRNLCKTGALFLAALEAACTVARADDARRVMLRELAVHLGSAFQIGDDLLDATATAAAAGKDVGQDAGKCTVVSLLGVDGARRAMRARLAQAHHIVAAVSARRAAPLLPRLLQATFGAEWLAAMASAPQPATPARPSA